MGLLKMPQNDYIQDYQRNHRQILQYYERHLKKKNKTVYIKHTKMYGLRAKIYARKRFLKKVHTKKTISSFKTHGTPRPEHNTCSKLKNALPVYLLERSKNDSLKFSKNDEEKSWKPKKIKSLPIPTFRPTLDDSIFKVNSTKKSSSPKQKKKITKVTFVGPSFTPKGPNYEEFIYPNGLRMSEANVTHPELKMTFRLKILGVKKNPNGTIYTNLGVITEGTIIEIDVSDLGLVTAAGKIVLGKFAQVTNRPENDGTINAILLI